MPAATDARAGRRRELMRNGIPIRVNASNHRVRLPLHRRRDLREKSSEEIAVAAVVGSGPTPGRCLAVPPRQDPVTPMAFSRSSRRHGLPVRPVLRAPPVQNARDGSGQQVRNSKGRRRHRLRVRVPIDPQVRHGRRERGRASAVGSAGGGAAMADRQNPARQRSRASSRRDHGRGWANQDRPQNLSRNRQGSRTPFASLLMNPIRVAAM